jgi:polyhydroxyalkanoate synthesis regulator protein
VARYAENAYFALKRRRGPAAGGTSSAMTPAEQPIAIKRYAGRRLYHAAIGCYLTLDDLAAMVEDDQEFVVREADTGADITRSVLKQIIVERGRHG